MVTRNILIGCVADDFTGASDAASFLVKGGLRTILSNGIPSSDDIPRDCDAVVIALKIRTIPANEAVSEAIAAFEGLKDAGCIKYYYKYCSTFDSTPKGNIGPVVDAAMELFQTHHVLLCPSLPVNGRTVKDGCLFVHGIPLAESPMKHHPLNPMWASSLEELMHPQGKHVCLTFSANDLIDRKKSVDKIARFEKENKYYYIVPDYETDSHGKQIADVFRDDVFFTGGSGLLEHLAKTLTHQRMDFTERKGTPGPGIALCGSCSPSTQKQIQHFKLTGGLCIAVDPLKLRSGEQTAESIWSYISQNTLRDILVYSIGAELPASLRTNDPTDAKRIEQLMADLAFQAVSHGFTRIICAGGETSGAITEAINHRVFRIGESVAPGVPILFPTADSRLRLVLKSGNFGDEDFFTRAFSMTNHPGE